MQHSDLLLLIADGLSKGAVQHSRMRYEWDIGGDCISPRGRTITATPEADTGRDYGYKPGKSHTLTLLLHTRCRKCETCLAQRSSLWMGRALGEIRRANRTWMCTFTLAEDQQYLYGLRAVQAEKRRGNNWDDLSSDDQLLARHRAIQGELTKWFKRLRKSGHSFRYLLVMEAHKSGLPHYHALLHEIGDPISYRNLKSANWALGFTRFTVAETYSCYYVTKYLAKDCKARVRASVAYGRLS